jgi:DNA excision repair protein ERCC-2
VKQLETHDLDDSYTSSVSNMMSWFPYDPRPHQEEAVEFASSIFSDKTVGLLSAECGVGKTVAVLSAYLATRSNDADWDTLRLAIVTRTHSQSNVFESELNLLKKLMEKKGRTLTATSMVSRKHICPMREKMEGLSNTGFMRACASMIKKGNCDYYWDFYTKDENGSPTITRKSLNIVNQLLQRGVVSRDIAVQEADNEGVCPYELLRWCAKQSKVVIGPYGYLFIERAKKAFLKSLRCQLSSIDLIVDEAHNLADFILDSGSAVLSSEDLQWLRNHKAEILRDTKAPWLLKSIDFLWTAIQLALDGPRYKEEIELARWDIIPRFIEPAELELLLENIVLNDEDILGNTLSETPFERLVHFLHTGMRVIESGDWHTTLEIRKRWDSTFDLSKIKLRIRPLNAAGLTAPILREARSAVLMSGTLRPLDHYSRLLGVSGARSIEIPSPYPSHSRLVLIDRDLTTRYKERSPETWRALASRIKTVLEIMPANKSALIAFPSYDMMREVLSYGLHSNLELGYRKRIVETRDARLEYLHEVVEEGPAAIFGVYGGKFTEGIDLVQNGSSMINLIIGVGVPFRPPTGFRLALTDWYKEKFGENIGYYYSSVVPSLRRVAQLIGRLRRSPTDWGVVVLLDKRFERHVEVLGKDIESNLWPYNSEAELETAIRMFIELIRKEDELH